MQQAVLTSTLSFSRVLRRPDLGPGPEWFLGVCAVLEGLLAEITTGELSPTFDLASPADLTGNG